MTFRNPTHLQHIHPDDYSYNELCTEAFAEEYQENIDFYIQMKLKGLSARGAFGVSFGIANIDSLLDTRVIMLEANPYTGRQMMKQLSKITPSELWDVKLAILTLRNIAVDNTERATSRIAAAKELNVLMGITYTDEKGNTQRRGLDAFYADQKDKAAQEAKGEEQEAKGEEQEPVPE